MDEWKKYRSDQQTRRVKRLPVYVKEILALRIWSYAVKRLTQYQYRIDGRLDLYPIHRRFHDTKTNERGSYKNALELCRRILDSLAI